jgi:glyoxylase-like metal-dependent hydrolase (beta-lactamase superfamily II)
MARTPAPPVRRRLILGAVLAVGALATAVSAMRSGAVLDRFQSPSPAALDAERIRENLYVLRGGGRTVQLGGAAVPNAGNTVAFITARGVILVDTKLPGWGRPIIEKLKELTDKPVTAIINTHTHMDHVSGNVEFPSEVDVVAHENTAALMREMRPVSGGPVQPNVFKENDGRGLPTRTFGERLTLGEGSDRVDLYYFGRAHTSGDAWVVFPAQRVLHAGDVFGSKAVPPLDANNGASGVEYPETIARAVAALTGIDVVITGHSPATLTMADLQRYGQFVRGFVEAVQAAKRAGRTIDDFVKTWSIPDEFQREGYFSIEHLRPLRPDVEVIWNETK